MKSEVERESAVEQRGTQVYPIAEIFTSPQGEGAYVGEMMTFIRLAGCTVGKKFPKERYEKLPHCEFKCKGGDPDLGHGPDCAYAKSARALPIYTEQCTLYDGRTFACDTDYRMKEKMTTADIMKQVPEEVHHICITGGEPLMHDLRDLIVVADELDLRVSVETSGTLNIMERLGKAMNLVWITVSPKSPYQDGNSLWANEFKLLVDENFDIKKVPRSILESESAPIYIQPVNDEFKINRENLKRVRDLQIKYPQFRVSLQLHKVMSELLGEMVR